MGTETSKKPFVSGKFPQRPLCLGRKKETTAVVKGVMGREHVPTLVLGSPGVGKSTIALEALYRSRIAWKYQQRRYFIRCELASSAEALAGILAEVLGAGLGQHPEQRVIDKLENLRESTLLLLDNFETPWEPDRKATEEFLSMLLGTKHIAIVVTLRGQGIPSNIHWGSEVYVSPLTLVSAREIFLKIAGNMFKYDNLLNILLEKVDYIPLAISLLAHLSKGEPDLSSVLRMWDDKKTDIHKTLSDSIELSINSPRMTFESKQLLTILGVLPGGIAWGDILILLPENGTSAAATLRKVGLAYDAEKEKRLKLLSPIREHVNLNYPPNKEDRERIIQHYWNFMSSIGEKINRTDGDYQMSAEASNIEAITLLYSMHTPNVTPRHAISAYSRATEFSLTTGLGSPKKLNEHVQNISDIVSEHSQVMVKQLENNELWQDAAEELMRNGTLSVPILTHALEKSFISDNWLLRRRIERILQAIVMLEKA